jgi:phospholipase/lecithinase/hemolysin
MQKFSVSIIAGCAVALAAATPTLSAQQRAPYSGIVVFGTSLSDSGNAFALRGGTSTPPDYDLNPLLIPDAPYARGGHHFSNGSTWVEQFARSLGLAGTVRPAFRSDSRIATNYAVGAARACDAPDSGNVNLADQVNAYLTDVGQVASSDALYVIEMGGNDVRDAIAAALGILQRGGTPQQAVQAGLPSLLCAQQSIQAAIQVLSEAGATQFLVWTAPDPGMTPAIRSLGAGAMQMATSLTMLFNTQMLLPTLQALDQASPDVEIAVLDAFTLLQQMNANPANFGLTNTTTACVTPNAPPFFCQAVDQYLFWDGIHPTRAAHEIVAHEAARILAEQ